MELKHFLKKAKDQVSYVADTASKKGKEVYESSKGNLKVFDLNTEIDALYKEIGKLVYQSHQGLEIAPEVVEQKVQEVLNRYEQINEIKAQNEIAKNTVICSNCNTIGKKKDSVCFNCGRKF